MKKILAMVVALMLALTLLTAVAEGGKIGVAMPTQSLQRWNQDGANMEKLLTEAGYEVDLQFADNDVAKQVSQLENMIMNGAQVLVIASIDGSALGTVLADAKQAGIPVIAYDRLIMQSDAVNYYATFDNYMVGTIQGKYIEEKLDLANAEGPFNIEFTGGSPDDNNAGFFFQGAMDVLNPYIESGKLVVKSGQVAFEECATPGWDTAKSQARMENILSAYYADGSKLAAVMCSNDSTAQGVTNALVSLGFEAGPDFPIITGQDCDIASVKNMIKGTQAMSVFKDTRTLAAKVVGMVDALMQGGEPEINDTESYNNGTGIIPTYLCAPVFGDINNYEELLLESGYYTADQLAE